MKFYFVSWSDEGHPEGIAGEYFKTKREAEKKKKELDKEDSLPPPPCQRCGRVTDSGRYCGYCLILTDPITKYNAELETIELSGSPREMCWKALHHQIIPE